METPLSGSLPASGERGGVRAMGVLRGIYALPGKHRLVKNYVLRPLRMADLLSSRGSTSPALMGI
jgi:hypothetical protein